MAIFNYDPPIFTIGGGYSDFEYKGIIGSLERQDGGFFKFKVFLETSKIESARLRKFLSSYNYENKGAAWFGIPILRDVFDVVKNRNDFHVHFEFQRHTEVENDDVTLCITTECQHAFAIEEVERCIQKMIDCYLASIKLNAEKDYMFDKD